jgi:hypothetical protein
VGCPIRKSRDHRSLASPPGFSQRATSFIASQCQGIHQMPFCCASIATPNGKDHNETRLGTSQVVGRIVPRRKPGPMLQAAFQRNCVPPVGAAKQVSPGQTLLSEDTSCGMITHGPSGQAIRPHTVSRYGHTTRFFTMCHQQRSPASRSGMVAEGKNFFSPRFQKTSPAVCSPADAGGSDL